MPSRHKRSPLSVRLDGADEAELRERAAERGIAVNEAVREAVRKWLDEQATLPAGRG